MSRVENSGRPQDVVENVSMSELARRVNLSVSTISRYWSGQRIPNFLIALQIADALDVDPYRLARLFKHAE